MAGLFTYSFAGVGFLAIAALESVAPSLPSTARPSLLFLRFFSSGVLSLLFLAYSFASTISSLLSHDDPIGASLPLSTLAASSLFLLYSLCGLLSLRSLLPVPLELLDLLLLFAFSQELLLLRLGLRKDTDGLEHRYTELLLVPVLICALSTLLSIARPRHASPRFIRAAALALHGTWLIQMGFSFFSSAMAHGCNLQTRSRTNFTIQCPGHAESHRASAIATLQFNCHLAFLIVISSAVYSVISGRKRLNGSRGYRPLNKELQRMNHVYPSRFTLLDDEETEEIAVMRDANGHDVVLSVPEANGFHDSH
ncbi:hypothetical protein IHE45_08G084100 [Dioscorea alata]|uniref:Uncharacterized protein n=4 Tax=Dioscorea alata TaxID=55571 RepID=A0ACB7VKK9_DIOAL|nr:hypothetical protein IHE45_08G084100 [Dioscorea alata]KAH7674585.1 hypothetical protein IHE45_08G084100 [Dioscorea alata]KAH7674586.1 hypothetical protein IHE45_08G084100 [Dioscorea alata]KAH7674587.1 hypothetical protein IHE45_08G084100 [Dioscorea alata]